MSRELKLKWQRILPTKSLFAHLTSTDADGPHQNSEASEIDLG